MTKITFVGCGNMAQAMISGLRASKQKFHIYVIEKNEELKNNFQDYQGQLSMGMSDDYEIDLDYGATIVRIGSKIFS